MRRILNSLAKAVYQEKDIPLVISIDHSGIEEVAQVAREFQWNYGSKEVICHKERLGIRTSKDCGYWIKYQAGTFGESLSFFSTTYGV